MQAAFDLAGFQARTMMPPDDVAVVEEVQPGFIVQRGRIWLSYIYGRLRKRYLTPFGLAMGAPTADGTSPPVVTYSGVPIVGSLQLTLFIAVAGVLGTAAFNWSVDGGLHRVSQVAAIAVTAPGVGYTSAPAVVIGPPDYAWGVQATATATEVGGFVTAVTVVTQGSGYINPPAVSFTGGGGSGAAASATLSQLQLLTAASVAIPGTGISALFPATGPYAVDNVYISATPIPEVVLGWAVALVTVDAYQRRGVNPADPQLVLVVADRDRALADIKEASDTKDGLFDLPLNDDTDSPTGIAVGGPFGYSEASPYKAFDIEARRGQCEDGLHFDQDGDDIEGPT